jgi:dTDP-4-dehydrorhamnose reductase
MQTPVITGVYHLVNNDNKINKYDLLCKINEIFALNKTIVQTQGPKPVNKILIDTRNVLKFNIPNYDVMLNELKNL